MAEVDQIGDRDHQTSNPEWSGPPLMSAENADTGGAQVPELGNTYTGPTAMQIGNSNQQTNYYDQRTFHSSAYEPTATLQELERQLRLRTPAELRVRRQGKIVERAAVDRSSAVLAVFKHMVRAAESGEALLVHGEPSVGKSVLCLQAVDQLRESGVEVVVVDLRECAPPLPTLESAVGLPLSRLFSTQDPGSSGRLVVFDGAEVIQEGARDRWLALADAGRRAGFGIVAVARDDAVVAVEEAFDMLPDLDLTKFRVESLPDNTLDELAARFPALKPLRERRSRWLLRRVGMVDLLLRADAVMPLRDGALSEADVFDVCWQGWVRSQNGAAGGVQAPDARDRALLEMARQELGLPCRWGGPDPAVLPSLRSDGLVRSFGPGSALRRRETFASDVVRDFATTRLVLLDGLSVLKDAGAPRWALRASLVACQARLLEALESDAVDETLSDLIAFFDQMAAVHGARWADIPWEAVLSVGVAPQLVLVATQLLLRDRGANAGMLLRVAEQRFVASGRAEPLPIEALVVWLSEQNWHALDVSRNVMESADRIVRYWLRGVQYEEAARDDPAVRRVKQTVRDVLLKRDAQFDELILEALATLGPDVNDDVRARLIAVAGHRPAALRPIVENAYAIMSLRERDVDLLAELALAYYIERPSQRHLSHSLLTGDGVRDHAAGYHLGVPRSAWWYGPFWEILCGKPATGLLVINTLLDHATSVRIKALTSSGAQETSSSEYLHVDMDLLDLGERSYAGDSHVYAWYRGSTVGPSVCTSALLAWERAADQLHAQGMTLREIVLPLLRKSDSLATVGAAVGFLVRHLPEVTNELDDFLAVPELWHYEDIRTMHESSGLTSRDEEELPGREWRNSSFRDVAAFLAAKASFANDEPDANRLRGVGARLLAACPTDADGREAIHARICATLLDTRNYRRIVYGTSFAMEYVEPADLSAELEETRRDLSDTRVLYELANRYSLTLAPPFGLGQPSVQGDLLAADVAKARRLSDNPPTTSDRMLHDTVVAVAGTVVRTVGSAMRVQGLSIDDLRWALETVVEAPSTTAGEDAYEGSLYSRGADRSAASASPSLLLPTWQTAEPLAHGLPRADEQAAATVAASMTSPTYEVRRCAALALRKVWAAPCGPAQEPCRHQRAWGAVEYGARDVAMAPWDGTGRRAFTTLDNDIATALRAADATNLVLPRLSTALAATLDAVSSSCCVATKARPLRDALIDAYARTAIHWAEEGFNVRAEEHCFIADALLAATATEANLVQDLVLALGGCSPGSAPLLQGLAISATYDLDRRAQLRDIWPTLLQTVLALPEPPNDRRSAFTYEQAVAALIPAPTPLTFDNDMTATLERARDGWPTAASLAELIPRWIPRATGTRGAVDSLIGLLRASPVDQQLTLGLTWIRALLPNEGTALGSFLIVEWLRELRASPHFNSAVRANYEVIVDALAAAGSVAARELQVEDE
ncbi:hypothetical protein [Streptomyces sp. NPDC059552]|uniref:hypothetical protein n=1 Tax=Streptomyces sp. NPDC059552 TaxID=3346862 RepID=UPI0036C9F357